MLTSKLFLFATALASASAYFTHTYVPVAYDEQIYFAFNYTIAADIYYETTYLAGKDRNDYDVEGYGLHFSSYVSFTLWFEIFRWYSHKFIFTFLPWDIVPYAQNYYFNQAEPGVGSHGGLYADRQLSFLLFKMDHVENFKVCNASVMNAVVY